MTQRLGVLVTAGCFPPASKAGGPVRSVAGITREETPDHDVTVIASNRDLGDTEPMPGTEQSPGLYAGAPVHYVDVRHPLRTLRLLVGVGRSRRDLLYLNSLFSPWFSLLPLLLWRLRIVRARVLLIAPRGELAASALTIKAWKKALVARPLRGLLRGPRVVWQATSPSEARDIKTFMPEARVVRHDNSWPLPADSQPTKADVLTLVYAGRIAPIKNPLTAILALRQVTSPVRLVMAGVREDEDLARRCEEAALTLPSPVSVTFTGHLSESEVAQVMDQAHGFILPTSGENFGHAIAEALARGCFLLVPDTTPWSAAVAEGAGRIITPEPSPSNERTLAEVTGKPLPELTAWGQESLAIYRRNYDQHLINQTSLFATALEASGFAR